MIRRVCLKKLDFSPSTDVNFWTSTYLEKAIFILWVIPSANAFLDPKSKKAPKKGYNFCQDIPVVVIGTKKFVFVDLKNVSLSWSKVQLKKLFHKTFFSAKKWQIPKKCRVFGNNLFWVQFCTKICSYFLNLRKITNF